MRKDLSPRELADLLQLQKVKTRNSPLFAGKHPAELRHAALTLVIAIGGNAAACVKETINTLDNNLEEGYKDYVKFMFVDSDTRAMNQLASEGFKAFNLSVPGEAERMQRLNRNEFLSSFVPDDYNVSMLTPYGASQDRMTGKIKLYSFNPEYGAANDVRLKQYIEGLFRGEWARYAIRKVNIRIVTSITGGTGSGTFQDIAAIVKNAVPEDYNTTTYAYILLPDVTDHPATPLSTKAAMYANGFAALKELEDEMGLIFEPDAKHTYRTNAGDITVDQDHMAIDYPILVSGGLQDASEALAVTLARNCSNDDRLGMSALIGSLYRNRISCNRKETIAPHGALQENATPEDSYLYTGIGYGKVAFPNEIIIPRIVAETAEKCTAPQIINHSEAEKLIARLFGIDAEKKISEDSLWKEIVAPMLIKACKPEVNPVELTLEDLQRGNWGAFLQNFHVKQKAPQAFARISGELKEFFEQYKANAASLMSEYGPHIMEFLYNGSCETQRVSGDAISDICAGRMIEYVQSKLCELPEIKYPEAIGSLPLSDKLFRKNMIIEEWKSKASYAAQREICALVARSLAKAYGPWQMGVLLNAYDFTESCIRFAQVLEVTTAFYKQQGNRLLDDVNRNSSADTYEQSRSSTANLCSDLRMARLVEEKIRTYLENMNPDIKSELISDFMSNMDRWTSDEPGSARKQYDKFFAHACSMDSDSDAATGFHLTDADYFEMKLAGIDMKNPAAVAGAINLSVGEIDHKLLRVSSPKLKLSDDVDPVDDPRISRTFIIPKELLLKPYGMCINRAFHNYVRLRDELITSPYAEHIECFTVINAVAMAELKDLNEWEAAYDNSPRRDSLHLTKQPATYYPSVNLRKYQSGFCTDLRTTESEYRRTVFIRKIEEALEKGVIEYVAEGHNHKFFLNANTEDRGTFRKQICLMGSYFYGSDGFDFTQIVQIEKWSDDKEKATAMEYMLRVMRKDTYLYAALEETLETKNVKQYKEIVP